MHTLERYILLLLTLGIVFTNSSFGQEKPLEYSKIGQIIPQEKIFIHYNKSFLLTGEQLVYKIYCINTATKNLSTLSKIAYVELVGSDKSTVFEHKIRLVKGMGQGDFFIPASIASGNYKLIAYTQWMRNGDESNFFQSDVSIVNPFNEKQQVFFESDDIADISEQNNIELLDKKVTGESSNMNKLLSIGVDSELYGFRQKVSLCVESLTGSEAFGHYSISVSKKDALTNSTKSTAENYNLEDFTLKEGNVHFLPELRGELLVGQVFIKGTKSPVSGIKLALSIQGKNNIFKIATTNKSGTFYFNLSENYISHSGTLRTFSDEEFDVVLDEKVPLNHENLNIELLIIPQQKKDDLLNRSIYNQIENAYISSKEDYIQPIAMKPPFYGTLLFSYDLDDYTRFPTFRETVVEILDKVFMSLRKGKREVYIPRHKDSYNSGFRTLILIDGIMVDDHEALLRFNARKINTIDVKREKHIFGGQRFEGLISMETYDGNFKGFESEQNVKTIELSTLQQQKSYYHQEYKNPEKSVRIPDFRSQLLWEPDFNLNSNKFSIEFYTSDNKGIYEVSLEGFTRNGTPVSLKAEFIVESN